MHSYLWRKPRRRGRPVLRVGRRILLLLVMLCTLGILFVLVELLGCGPSPHTVIETNAEGMQREPKSPLPSFFATPTSSPQKMAYAVVITNENCVDGALVLGFSLLRESSYAAEKVVDLVLIHPVGRISVESRERLRCAGWSRLVEVPDFSVYTPRARLKDTFNKLHILNLTEYSRVALLDGDMLMIGSPDELFETKLPNASYVGAIGSRSTKYFQTGMMLVIPSSKVFYDLLHRLKTDVQHQLYSGRDGAVIRDYFGANYVIVKNAFSRHVYPEDPFIRRATGLHYRGNWKPWFNMEEPPQLEVQTSPKTSLQELGGPYRLWWEAYEQLHMKCMAPRDAMGSPTRDVNAPADYNPMVNMWLMRHTRHSYVQLMKCKLLQKRNMTFAGLRVVATDVGASCDESCHENYDNDDNGKTRLKCVEKALSFLRVNSPEALQLVFRCAHTTMNVPEPYQPSFNTKTKACHVNSLYGKRERPTCGAKDPLHRRLCACIKATDYRENLSFTPDASPISYETLPCPTMDPGVGWNGMHTKNDVMSCSQWVPESTCDANAVMRSKNCASFLLYEWKRVEVIPRQWDARTIKVRFHYEKGISAIVKLEQLSFPLEPHAEYGAYAASLLLGIGMVPPTELLRVPAEAIREALLENVNETEKRFLEDELPWMRHNKNAKEMITVSVQLWITNGLVSFHNAVPPITEDVFNCWLQPQLCNVSSLMNHALLFDVATMRFFDYIIANADRTFMHNTNILENGDTRKVVLLDHGKSLHTDAVEVKQSFLSSEKTGANSVPMCRLPRSVLRRALRLTKKSYQPLLPLLTANETAQNGETIHDSETLAGQLLRAAPSRDVAWGLQEKNIAAVQLRLEKALEHFAKCVGVFGLSHVIGD